jgi:hypothetical protein
MEKVVTDKFWLPPFKGEIEILTPKKELIYKQPNLVVLQSKIIAVRAISGLDPQSYTIKHFALGTGTTPPKATDTTLEDEKVRIEITSVSFPSESSVLFEAYMDYDVGNGTTYTEMGLVTQPSQLYPNGLLFARALLKKPFSKTEELAFILRWKITAA